MTFTVGIDLYLDKETIKGDKKPGFGESYN